MSAPFVARLVFEISLLRHVDVASSLFENKFATSCRRSELIIGKLACYVNMTLRANFLETKMTQPILLSFGIHILTQILAKTEKWEIENN